ncbi:lipid droplet-associated hydrolase isoform X1 [Phalacrocorax carbo]|uniref:lipid droplet-associated hydrolase isoform X1 n=1 Tax=Phalacrocorax carbo TaxID=9209 RepID=UPI00311A6663
MTETEANPHDGCLGGPSLLLPPLPGGRRMPVPPGLGRPFPPERGPAAGAGEARPPQESRPPAPRTARRAAASLAERGGGGGRRSGAALSPPRAARAEGTAQPPPPPPPAAALRGLAGCFRPVSADLAAAAMLGAGEPAKGEANTRSASEEPVPLHEEFIYCCGAATHVLKCGPWKDLSKDESKNLPRLLFMIIPGNPGLAGYYRTFIQALYCGLNQQYPVWVVSHAGHCKPPSGMEMMEDTDIKELEDVFGLNGQVEHKLNFLKKNVSKDIKLVLIAHSIGCYITLEMMKRASELQVLRSVLLFPTIERMAQSPQGKLMTPLLCKLRYVLYMPVYLLSFLPEGVKASLVRFALRGMKTCDESSITTSVNLFSVDCIANILYMASQEMMKVVERDSTTIKQNLKKLIFYYGTGDSWCPQQYYDEIKMDFPDGDIRLCEKGLRHAFVLDASKEMAAMITDWLQDDLTKL